MSKFADLSGGNGYPRRLSSRTSKGGYYRDVPHGSAVPSPAFVLDPVTGARKEQFMSWFSFNSYTRCSLLGLLACMLAFASAWAQTGTTSLHGTVSDKTGAVVTGARVGLDNPEQGIHREAITGSQGEYEFQALQPGTYLLTIQMAGFRKYEQKNLQLLVNLPATTNVVLEVGTTAQTVEVSAQSETLNTTDASLGIAFNENQVKQLPLEGRNVPDLLSLQAGVAYTGNRSDINQDVDTRSGAVNGAH